MAGRYWQNENLIGRGTMINRLLLQVRNVFFFGLLVLTNNIKATGPANDQIT